MQRAGPRDGDLGAQIGVGLQEREIADIDRMRPLHAARDQRHRLCAAASALGLRIGIGSAIDHIDRDVSELAVEEAVIRPAAEFAVRHEAKTQALLQRDGVADGVILRRGELGLCDLAARETRPGIAQRLRAQQAADVLGAERRLLAQQRHFDPDALASPISATVTAPCDPTTKIAMPARITGRRP
jgi:hypothetical protein